MSSHRYVQRDSPSPTLKSTYCLFPSIPISADKRGQANPNFPRLLATLATDRRFDADELAVTIDILHDDVLLEIFDSYRKLVSYFDNEIWKWQKLLHVCRRWRHIVLSSPRRLSLRITCDPRTPTRKLLDIWPPFPISVSSSSTIMTDARRKDNIIAALERRDRIFRIDFSDIPSAELDQLVSTMEEPFPALTHLRVYPDNLELDWDSTNMEATVRHVTPLPLPNAFLGRSAPRLQELSLQGISFPALPDLVLSTSHLHKLHLHSVPHAGYISPQALVTVLLALPNLKSLTISFASPESRPLQMSPPPLTRAVLPSLTHFRFSGASEYLADFIAQIDTSLLNRLYMRFFSDLIFEIPRLYKFLDRGDERKPFTQAALGLRPAQAVIFLESPSGFKMDVASEVSDWLLKSMTRLCDQLTLLSQVERLEIHYWDGIEFQNEEEWQEIVDDPDWLELLNAFVSVKCLYIADRLGLILLSVLEKITGERATGVLPALQNLFISDLWPQEEFVEKTVASFVSARQLYDLPIVVRRWEREVQAVQEPDPDLLRSLRRHR